MINIKYNQKSACYIVELSGLGDRIVTGKFDTGAVATIITTKKLGLTDKQFDLLKKHFDTMVELPKSFHSATNGEMKGYLVRARNVMLYQTCLKDFYYYLVLDNNLNKALLGDDFISCCTFNHRPQGDIVITTIDRLPILPFIKRIMRNVLIFLKSCNWKLAKEYLSSL